MERQLRQTIITSITTDEEGIYCGLDCPQLVRFNTEKGLVAHCGVDDSNDCCVDRGFDLDFDAPDKIIRSSLCVEKEIKDNEKK